MDLFSIVYELLNVVKVCNVEETSIECVLSQQFCINITS